MPTALHRAPATHHPHGLDGRLSPRVPSPRRYASRAQYATRARSIAARSPSGTCQSATASHQSSTHTRRTFAAIPAGGSSYLAPMAMTGRRSFAYHKLKKLPPAPAAPTAAATLDHQDLHSPPSAAAIEESYVSYYLALGAAAARGRRRRQWQRPRRVRPRLRISGLARALRRGAAAAGARVRASVAKVARRLREGRPYIGDLFAGNYMFLQVAPSPTMVAGVDDKQGRFAPFTDYYYAKVAAKSIMPPPPPTAAGALQVYQPAAAAAGVMYKV